MPVRDGERWLCEAIDSIVGQTLRNLELIVIDDGSRDSTPQLLSKYATQDLRIRIFSQGSLGLAAALNKGLQHARAPLIGRLDADDIALPTRLDAQYRFLLEHPQVGLLGSWAERIDEFGTITGLLKPPLTHPALSQLLWKSNPFIHPSVMFRTSVARAVGGYRACCEAAEDYDLWLRIAEVAELSNLPAALVRYRWYGANTLQRKAARMAFSARLARRSAYVRRSSGVDPLASIAAPPNWWAEDAMNAFWAEDARVCRFLALADQSVAKAADLNGIDLPEARQLTHFERKLARSAIVNLAKRGHCPRQFSLRFMARLLLELWVARIGRAVSGYFANSLIENTTDPTLTN